MFEKFRDSLAPHGIIVETFNFSAIRPDKESLKAIQEKVNAKQRLETLKVQREQAKVQAEKLKIEAQGKAEAKVIEAKAQAEANRILRASLSPVLVQYETVKRWNGQLPMMTGGNAMLNLPPTGSSPLRSRRASDGWPDLESGGRPAGGRQRSSPKPKAPPMEAVPSCRHFILCTIPSSRKERKTTASTQEAARSMRPSPQRCKWPSEPFASHRECCPPPSRWRRNPPIPLANPSTVPVNKKRQDSGRVTCRKTCPSPAPIARAASSRSRSTDSNPALKV